jgi:type 1 glutamine amidotransferase
MSAAHSQPAPPPPASAAAQSSTAQPQSAGRGVETQIGGRGNSFQIPGQRESQTIVPTVVDVHPGMKKLLVIADVSTGLHHESINHAMGVIEEMGRQTGLYYTVLRTDSQLVTKQPILGEPPRYTGQNVNADNLNYFDAVYFLGSGVGHLSAQQKQDLISFVRDDGKGFVGGHASLVAFPDWPDFTLLTGGTSASTTPLDTMGLIVDDPAFAGSFPKTFNWFDQYFFMAPEFSSKNVHVIMRLDPRLMTKEQLARRPNGDGDFPAVWAYKLGKGRVFNSTIGHDERDWDDEKFKSMQLEAIKWALGLTDHDVTPGNSKPPIGK